MNKIVFSKLIIDAFSGKHMFRLLCWTNNTYLLSLQRNIGMAFLSLIRFVWLFRVFIFLKEIMPCFAKSKLFSGYIATTIAFYLYLFWIRESYMDKFIIIQIFMNGIMVVVRSGRISLSESQMAEINQFNSQIGKVFPKKRIPSCQECDTPILIRGFHCPFCSILKRRVYPNSKHSLLGAQLLHNCQQQPSLYDVPFVDVESGCKDANER